MDAKPISNSPLNLQASAADPPLGSGYSKRSAYNVKIFCQVVVLQFEEKAKKATKCIFKPGSLRKTLEVPRQNGDDFQHPELKNEEKS